MLIYNTTYQTEIEEARNFVIWVNEYYIPFATESGMLKNPRLTRILSHREQDSECFSLQWEVEDTQTLHRWYILQEKEINAELAKLFKDKVIGFSTLMEVIE